MRRGVWIVEELAPYIGAEWEAVGLYMSRRFALDDAKKDNDRCGLLPPEHRHKYRAVRYVPAESAAAGRKRRKR